MLILLLLDVSSLTLTEIIIQAIYQDVLNPPDYSDQIMYNIQNTYDRHLFNFTLNSLTFSYYSIGCEAYQYSDVYKQWYIQVAIGFTQPTKFLPNLLTRLLKVLSSQSEFQILTQLDSEGFET
jgi:hypothetical protein